MKLRSVYGLVYPLLASLRHSGQRTLQGSPKKLPTRRPQCWQVGRVSTSTSRPLWPLTTTERSVSSS